MELITTALAFLLTALFFLAVIYPEVREEKKKKQKLKRFLGHFNGDDER